MDLSTREGRIPGMHRSLLRALLLLLLVLQLPAVARAGGQPVLGYAGPGESIRSGNGVHHYLAHARRGHTLVEDVTRDGTLAHVIPGHFAIALVALDGSPGGLSGDGRTLVLTRPRSMFPESSTQLAVVDASTLRLVRVVRLRGDFSVDAVSPNGQWVYLIQYTGTRTTQYRVRALDTRTGRLVAHDIIDPHDRGEKMQGYPLSRLSSPGGRWAYTLYLGGDAPFIHALDTPSLKARCIDLPAFPKAESPFAVKLRLDGHRLSVAGRPADVQRPRHTLLAADQAGESAARVPPQA